MKTIEKAKEITSQAVDFIISDRPLWAKIVGTFGGVVCAFAGAISLVNPATIPAILVTYQGLISLAGGTMVLFAQGQKRK